MKGLGLLFPACAVALLLAGTSWAQNVGDNSVYFVTYYSNAQHTDGLDQNVRIINDGDTGGNLWASFYVFDDSQEMQSCCSCEVTPDGLTSESVQNNLTAHSLTGKLKTRGLIKVISSSVPAAGPTNFKNNPTPGLRLWATHIQRQNPTDGAFFVTESQASAANLVSSEESVLETLCYYVYLLGGDGPGICTCTPEDADF
jgi:hypothetical protein